MEERGAPSSAEDAPGRRFAGSALRVLLGLILASVALAWLVRRGTFDPHQFAQAAVVLGPGTLAVGCAGAMGVVSLQALRWWFVTRKVAMGTHTDVLTLHLDGRAVSGAFVASFGDTMYVPFASSRPSVFPMRPNHLLYWEILRLSQQRGLRTLDFGSSLRDSSGLMFKRRWGARPEPVASYLWGAKGVVPAIEPGDSALARATVRLWKRLPRFLTEALGPTVIQWIA